MNKFKGFASLSLSLMTVNSTLLAEQSVGETSCDPTPPAACNSEECVRTYCQGPETFGVNAAVNPITCNGDWVVELNGLYWKAYQEGLDYVIRNQVSLDYWNADWDTIVPPHNVVGGTPGGGGSFQNSKFCELDFDWTSGFKLGLGYNFTCDGWGFIINWTKLNANASSLITVDPENEVLVCLLSNWAQIYSSPFAADAPNMTLVAATSSNAAWGLKLNLWDLELGRKFWQSKSLALRPFVGLRYASLNQDYSVVYRGGEFQLGKVYDTIDMYNNFHGLGLRSGLESTWDLFCGWGVYGDFALSMVYGKFSSRVYEVTVPSEPNPASSVEHTNVVYTDLRKQFNALRLIADFSMGIQWSSVICECKYGLTVALGWEQHIFLNQNQLFRVSSDGTHSTFLEMMAGDLDTKGGILSVALNF